VARGTRWLVASVGAASLLAAACGSSTSSAGSTSGQVSGKLVVFAAASLNGAFDKIGSQFEKAHPGVSVKFSYAGSSAIATQIKQGARADVFASANTKNMTAITSDQLARDVPVNFARNKLEIATESGNPMHIKSVKNLGKNSVKVAVCAPAVPCGTYSQEVFKKAGVTVRPVSEEPSVSSVVTKVSLGEADAGIVYTTDVKAGGSKVTGVPIPADQNVTATYPIVELSDAPNAAAAASFVKYVRSSSGQKVLASFGFLPPSS
jgi:molybdate transport system substrate-binding protein